MNTTQKQPPKKKPAAKKENGKKKKDQCQKHGDDHRIDHRSFGLNRRQRRHGGFRQHAQRRPED